MCIETGGVATIAEDYCRNLFTASNNLNMDGVLASVERVVTEDMAKSLVRTYTKDEVRVTLFQMHPSKALDQWDMMSP